MSADNDNASDLFLRGLIHDLNNVFQSFVDAADRLSDVPGAAHIAERILAGVEMGRSITLSAVPANAVAADSSGAEPTRAPLAQIVSNSARFVRQMYPDIEVRASIDPSIALTNSWAWERVFLNLFLNSARAMSGTGVIEVDACVEDARTVVRVRDHGTGFAPDILHRAFEPGASTNGSGLGLYIVRAIAQANGATVEARNHPDRPGAEVCVSLA